MNGGWMTDTTLYTFLALKRETISSISALLKSNDEGTPTIQVPTSWLNKADDWLMVVVVVLPLSQTVLHCFQKVDFQREFHVTLSIGA